MASSEDSVEVEALQVLRDLESGKISIGDIMGPLYVSGKEMNGSIIVPAGQSTILLTIPAPFNGYKCDMKHVRFMSGTQEQVPVAPA